MVEKIKNMTTQNNTGKQPENKMSFFDYFFEVIGWLQIAVSPLLFGLVIGALIYFSNPGTFRFVLAILVVTIGLIAGIIFATRVWKKGGTMHFVSRVMATPELDGEEEKKI
jgi:amino acid transporter